MSERSSILLIDDNEHNRLLYQEMLKKHNFHVATACDGSDAVHFFTMVHPDIDLVILDVEMPGLNGSECLRAMRALNPEICCLAITAHIDHPSLADMIKQGISGILRKPFSSEELAGWVRRLLTPKQVESEYSLQTIEEDPFE